MIDLHRHILPGFADGQATMTSSVKLASEAAKQGISSIIAAPHHPVNTEGGYNAILDSVADLNAKLKESNVPVEILPGQGNRIHGELMDELRRGEIMPIGSEGKYVLLELPYDHVPDYTTNVVFEMQIAGYIPVFSQPERNDEIVANPDKLYRLVKNGALVQLGAANVAGKGGRKTAKFIKRLIDANLAHLIATGRQPRVKSKLFLKEAYQQVGKSHGSSRVADMQDNADALVTGRGIIGQPPERVAQKKWLF